MAPRTQVGRGPGEIRLTRDEQKLYEALKSGDYTPKTQDEALASVSGKSPEWLAVAINKLVHQQLVILKQDSSSNVSYQAVAEAEAKKVRELEDDDRMVYLQVKDAGSSGVWTRTIKQKTALHTTVINRAIKTLETRSMIKGFRHVQYQTRKYYILYDLSPSVEASGGTFFQDSELDQDFVQQLRKVIMVIIERKAGISRSGGRGGAVEDDEEERYRQRRLPPGSLRKRLPRVEDLMTSLNESGITQQPLALADVQAVVNTLVYDGKLQPVGHIASGKYLPVRRIPAAPAPQSHQTTNETNEQPQLSTKQTMQAAITQVPCGNCPVAGICQPGGVVSPEGCGYWDTWLSKML
ncbi:34-kDa subunit of RNA polymerase III (C) [Savitreella phatthalungensis]